MKTTSLEMCFLILYRKIKYLSRIDNNNCPDIILDEIREKIESFDTNLKETFGKDINDIFRI